MYEVIINDEYLIPSGIYGDVQVKFEIHAAIIGWCQNNDIVIWEHYDNVYCFEDEDDSILFQLKWA